MDKRALYDYITDIRALYALKLSSTMPEGSDIVLNQKVDNTEPSLSLILSFYPVVLKSNPDQLSILYGLIFFFFVLLKSLPRTFTNCFHYNTCYKTNNNYKNV